MFLKIIPNLRVNLWLTATAKTMLLISELVRDVFTEIAAQGATPALSLLFWTLAWDLMNIFFDSL